MVTRAVHSALAQTFDATEVIVVVDGPDDATIQVLHEVDDRRLRVKVLSRRRGPGGARNAGVDEARGRWVAFLDDDDEWLPRKLEIQLETARQSVCRHPIVSCRLSVRGEQSDRVWPRRLPEPGEPLSEYLFCQKRGPFWGEGVVSTSTVLTPAQLMRLVRFKDLPRLEDVDWLLRAVETDDARVQFVEHPEPLAIRHPGMEPYRKRTGTGWSTSKSLAWIRANRHLVTRRAYASFVLSWEGSRAAYNSAGLGVFLMLLREALRGGRPTPGDVLYYLLLWLVPWRARRGLEAFVRRRLRR